MSNITIDLETLGTRAGCRILSLGAVEFSAAGGLGAEFYCVLDPADQERFGLHSDPETEQWWSERDPEAREAVFGPEVEKLLLAPALASFNRWCWQQGLKNQLKVWANGASFDNVILTEVYRAHAGPALPWSFWNDRCFRAVRAMLDPGRVLAPPFEGIEHHALHDAKHQARYLLAMLRAKGVESWLEP